MSYTAGHQSTLLKAYESACYEVLMDTGALDMRVGQPLPAALEAYLDANGIETAAFISAANPLSRPMTAEDNAGRHTQLLRALRNLGVLWLPGYGRDPCGVWGAETSVLALRLARVQAMQLAERFEQNAYIEVLPQMPAKLVLTTHWRVCNTR
ncbi:MAG: hypothetical protein ACI9DC_003656 [Gammaproteobacteria bacterium]|jgi:hypothetical protein